jgi:hypothetical protein
LESSEEVPEASPDPSFEVLEAVEVLETETSLETAPTPEPESPETPEALTEASSSLDVSSSSSLLELGQGSVPSAGAAAKSRRWRYKGGFCAGARSGLGVMLNPTDSTTQVLVFTLNPKP